MDRETIYGGCYCRAIRYKAFGIPKYTSICYCEDCRRIAGAQSVAWVTFHINNFTIEKGVPVQFQSSKNVVRTFCGTCGTSLSYQAKGRAEDIDITTASLDNPEQYPPRKLVFAKEKLNWDVHLNLPEADSE